MLPLAPIIGLMPQAKRSGAPTNPATLEMATTAPRPTPTMRGSRLCVRATGARWGDCATARDDKFAATDTSWPTWQFASSWDKKRVRLDLKEAT